jgi:hypothetical protein
MEIFDLFDDKMDKLILSIYVTSSLNLLISFSMSTILSEPDIILDPLEIPAIPLPKNWMDYTLLAILHVIALVRIIILNAANLPNDKECDGLHLRVENDRLRLEIGLLQREN